MSLSFLADENISPETAGYLQALGFPCRTLRRDGPWRLTDREIAGLARREGLAILSKTSYRVYRGPRGQF